MPHDRMLVQKLLVVETLRQDFLADGRAYQCALVCKGELLFFYPPPCLFEKPCLAAELHIEKQHACIYVIGFYQIFAIVISCSGILTAREVCIPQELYIPLMHCKKCNYNMCPKCAFSKITSFEQNIPKLMKGDQIGSGMIYCGNNYTNYESCLCGTCDGNCGPDNGCPCPLCDSILGYNIYLKSNKMRCDKCKNLLVKTYLCHLKKIKGSNRFQCFLCSYIYDNQFDCQVIYYCFKCKRNVCQSCAYKNNILNIKNLCFPKPPFFLGNMEEMKRKIQKEKIEECKICKQRCFNINTKKEGGKIICIYLKTLIGRIYTIKIDDSENIRKLKEELRKFDEKYKFYNTILFYKNKILDDDDYINNCGIDNESLINIILK